MESLDWSRVEGKFGRGAGRRRAHLKKKIGILVREESLVNPRKRGLSDVKLKGEPHCRKRNRRGLEIGSSSEEHPIFFPSV